MMQPTDQLSPRNMNSGACRSNAPWTLPSCEYWCEARDSTNTAGFASAALDRSRNRTSFVQPDAAHRWALATVSGIARWDLTYITTPADNPQLYADVATRAPALAAGPYTMFSRAFYYGNPTQMQWFHEWGDVLTPPVTSFATNTLADLSPAFSVLGNGSWTGSGTTIAIGGTAIPGAPVNNTWVTVAHTWDGSSTGKLYANGALIATSNTFTSPVFATALRYWCIGSRRGSGVRFPHRAGIAAAFSSALNAAQQAQLHTYAASVYFGSS